MDDLVDRAIRAAGGMDRYRSFRSVSAQLHHTGAIWKLKQRDGVLTDSRVTVQLHEQRVSHAPFAPTTDHSVYTPARVEIRRADGSVVEALDAPRASFDGYEMETPWSNAQLAYFAGYTMWTYLTSPFLLRHDGVSSREIEPWRVDGLPWRRLRVEFPTEIATHSAVQTFYFDADGLLRRHDYEVDIQGRNAAARYLGDYVDVQGIRMPTRFRIYPRTAENLALPAPLIVGVDLSNFRFE
ncbi:hypothetical protein FEP63_03261 [Burkholderia multivorans]|uniref:hypothetical protein n=2 Tax=Burkholderia multivorans TaxID=87883 RepID=UPI000277FCC4|nr:hypothetical protein [Burkholderia multivorans]EJO56550.1 hypothetical protein BURMUCF2_A1847 [Burkholderia multivorans CF2]MBJ9654070.1 hypothetical protein [Burkholderia multivorans]MBR8045181.1 hypothetical protein [Burkholderia multivorans]MBU9470539.1 hypothetical protein [Burkholderia multivorans]MDR8873991.1 hypothetical protein [Burkholderia multivorans]